MAKYSVKNGHRYRCKVTLSGVETWASNSTVAQRFADLGFIGVQVTGGGYERVAEGTWGGANIDVETPEQLSDIKEIEAEDADEEDDDPEDTD